MFIMKLQIAAKLGTSAAGPPAAAPAANGASAFGGNPNPLTGGLPDKGNPNNMPLGVKRAFPGGDEDVSAKKSASEPDGKLDYCTQALISGCSDWYPYKLRRQAQGIFILGIPT